MDYLQLVLPQRCGRFQRTDKDRIRNWEALGSVKLGWCKAGTGLSKTGGGVRVAALNKEQVLDQV